MKKITFSLKIAVNKERVFQPKALAVVIAMAPLTTPALAAIALPRLKLRHAFNGGCLLK
jgi:hypothetical protein